MPPSFSGEIGKGDGARGGGRPFRGDKLREGGQIARPSLLLAQRTAVRIEGKKQMDDDADDNEGEIRAIAAAGGDEQEDRGGHDVGMEEEDLSGKLHRHARGKKPMRGQQQKEETIKRGSLFDEAMRRKI